MLWLAPEPDIGFRALTAAVSGSVPLDDDLPISVDVVTVGQAGELAFDTVARTDTARETTAAVRLYGIVKGGELAYAEGRALRAYP